MTRAERRRADRDARRCTPPPPPAPRCDRCGLSLSESPTQLPTLSVDLGDSVLWSCGFCAPDLALVLGVELPAPCAHG